MREREINEVATFTGARRVNKPGLNGIFYWEVEDPLFAPLVNDRLDLPQLFRFDTDYNWLMALFHKINRDIIGNDEWQRGNDQDKVQELISLYNVLVDAIIDEDNIDAAWDAMYLLIHFYNENFDHVKPNI